jgi:rhamnose utilization protein RhaD (predicted bifunctional aldolase and dehydrogenase)/NAD(P)-dependent dehydrogenase (short-subunit alcohol dehydrogenase family)
MVQNRWDDNEAQKFIDAAGNGPADRELALRVYTSRIIGQDLNLVLHGGGNTSCKVKRKDIFGNEIDVLHVKGSGWDLGVIKAVGLPGVRLSQLRELRQLDALSDEDMVNLQRANLLDSTSPNPSVETLLHAFLPHTYVDHTHASAMLSLADLPNVKDVVAEIFGDLLVCVPFIMPGFELAKVAAEVYDANPNVEGLILINHGHFAFGDTARQSYDRLIAHTNIVEAWLEKTSGSVPKSATGRSPEMSAKGGDILPMLRGLIGDANARFTGNRDFAMPVMDMRNGDNVQEFFARDDLATLSRRGVATPDHVIRTKNYPLYLTADILAGGREAVAKAVDEFIVEYTAYFDKNAARFGGAKTMLMPTPNLAWIEGVGVVGISANAKAAAAASDLAAQNITAMTNAQACGGFFPVDAAKLFDMEYWSLEQAKLGKGKPPAMQGRIVMITGGGGAIGLATAREFATLGANVFLVDLEATALDAALTDLGTGHGGVTLDITEPDAAARAMDACIQKFGGLDILVSNAGAAWTGEMINLDDTDLRKSFELNFFAHQTFAKAAAGVFATQGRGGQILINVSKQAVNPGKGFGAYGIPKAATFFLLRQLALELGPQGVRVNGINADRIRSGLLDADFVTERAKARGIDEDTYMAGNLLRREVEASHVGKAFAALAQSERTTAHVMTVDGGNIEAALR